MELPRTPSTRLDGRRALVTGAGRGIGLACAAALSQAGAHVVLVARTTSEVEEVAQAICRDGGTAEAITLDITDLDALNKAIAGLEPFDVLVNNAGTNRPVTFLEVAVNDFDYMVSLNLRAAFFTAQAVARRMVECGKRGSIINISSDMGLVGGPNRTGLLRNKAWYGRHDQSHGNRSRPPRDSHQHDLPDLHRDATSSSFSCG